MAGGRGSGNGGNDLNEVVRQLAAVAQQLARNSTSNGDAQGELFKKVAQSKPPTYQSEPDPIILENLLREFEKLFGAVGCPENSKVSCATYYPRGEADLWWQQNETTVRALPGFNWTKFQEKVRDKFYPSFLRKQKAEEFSNLKMEKMSVTEYYTKFIQLSLFAEGSVSTEKAKARMFDSGLTTNLQLKLCGQVFEILDEVYGRVAHLYALEEKKKKELAEIERREKRKEVGQVSGNQQGNQNGFKKQKYHYNNNFHNNNNFQGNNRQGNLLFDSGATFSFVSKGIVSKLKDCLKTVEVVDLPITTPTGGVVKCTKTFRNVPLEIVGKIFPSKPIEFGLSDFDLILGMDWLSKYNAEISCRSQKVKMVTSGNESVT
ncbi:uncharacterized protein LOC110694909 [Chenopodium quinoa]|uniref:uncharacterized protein LOC110694909 n=1 Tax=Chenopodium quinoa TaxID=63459 RepID=UPI000B7708D0|nr:uncharacterized protein LOC110694909 [Chenopodium quinoa]